jgi:hypothetical protein
MLIFGDTLRYRVKRQPVGPHRASLWSTQVKNLHFVATTEALLVHLVSERQMSRSYCSDSSVRRASKTGYQTVRDVADPPHSNATSS